MRNQTVLVEKEPIAKPQAPILLGKHLLVLAKKLAKSDTYVSFWVGLTLNRWFLITEDGTRKKRNTKQNSSRTGIAPGELKGNQPLMPRHAILARFLINHPQYFSPFAVSFDQLYKEIKDFHTENKSSLRVNKKFFNSFSQSKLALILGVEPSAAVRIMEGATNMSPTVTNMINIIYINLKLAVNVEEKYALLNRLKDNVDEEAAARGIPYGKIWEKGGFNKLATKSEIIGQKDTEEDNS